MSCSDHRRRRGKLPTVLLASGLLATLWGLQSRQASGTESGLDAMSGEQSGFELSADHRQWLERVALLILPEERKYFLSIQEPFRREAFIESFWQVRDPDTETARNEFRRSWDQRIDIALADYGSVTDARSVMLLLNGEPGRFRLPDGRVIARCYRKRQKVEVWFYRGSLRTDRDFVVVLYAPEFPSDSEYRIWLNREAMKPAQRLRLPVTNPSLLCDDNTWGWAMRAIADMGWDVYRNMIEDLTAVPKPESREWIATFTARSTLLPEGAETFAARVDFDFPSRNQNRVAVRGVIGIPGASASVQEVKGRELHEFLVTGEVVRDDRLFEQFRYRYEIPVNQEASEIPLVFQRYLRPGSFRMLLKVEDLLSRRFAVIDRLVTVPEPDALESTRTLPDGELFRRLEEARQAAERGQTTIRILPPLEKDIMVGALRVNTVSAGEFRKVAFFLDGSPLLTKKRPPFSVELNLGEVAASHRLRVVAYDEHDAEVASDEMVINQGGQRFRVRLVEPRADRTYGESFGAVVQVEVPDGQQLDKVELYLDEQRVASLYQPPFEQAVLLTSPAMAYVRAVGYLTDGNTTEDVVFINAPDYFERLDVQFVELYASVVDTNGQALLDLEKDRFRVYEDGEQQEIRRFEHVRDLPIHAALLVDTSASMEETLPQVAEAAKSFVEQAIESRDRVTLLGFDARPRVEARFTNDVSELSAALTRLRPGGGTAIYDSLVFALHYFDGVKGPKALLLLSDGKDETSHFDLEGAMAVAHRVGVTVYVIGLRELARDKTARRLLRRVARETGGRSYFIEDPSELPTIYRSIQDDLRSQYLIAYQSTSDKDPSQLRAVRVEVDEPGAEARTVSGYYP